MSSGKKLFLIGAVALAIAAGFLAYSRSSATADAPQPATTPVETASEILPGGEQAPATPAAEPAPEAQPTVEPATENGQPTNQNPE